MSRNLLHAVLLPGALMGSASMPLVARATTALEIKPVKIDLPDSDRMFTGPGADAINNNCLACHSADMVLDQPLLPRATWAAEVAKMRATYKAPLTDADIPLIVDYLAATHAPPQ